MPTNEIKTKIIQIKLGNNKKFIEPTNFNDEDLLLKGLRVIYEKNVKIMTKSM